MKKSMKKTMKKTMKKIKLKRSKRKGKSRSKRKYTVKCINLNKIGGSGKHSTLAKKTMIKNARKTRKERIRKERKRLLNRNLSMTPGELMKQRAVYTPSGRRTSASIYRKKTRV
tara:strand:- start:219 stop:560 length:342 start_codon:yes stop_codon:yes gene_type:complete